MMRTVVLLCALSSVLLLTRASVLEAYGVTSGRGGATHLKDVAKLKKESLLADF